MGSAEMYSNVLLRLRPALDRETYIDLFIKLAGADYGGMEKVIVNYQRTLDPEASRNFDAFLNSAYLED